MRARAFLRLDEIVRKLVPSTEAGPFQVLFMRQQTILPERIDATYLEHFKTPQVTCLVRLKFLCSQLDLEHIFLMKHDLTNSSMIWPL